MTATALATPDPGDRSPLDRELESLIRWAGAAYADPTTDEVLRSDLGAFFDMTTLYTSRQVAPELRAAMGEVLASRPPVGGLWDAQFRALIAYGERRKAA